MAKIQSMASSADLFKSRTVWANVVGLAAVVCDIFGYHITVAETSELADAAVQIVTASAFIASTIFHITTGKGSTPANHDGN